MNTAARALYWALVGASFGFGVLGILSIGLPFLILGVVLLIVGAVKLGGRGAWGALIGLGIVPAAILLWDVVSYPWACDTGGVVSGSGSSDGTPVSSANYYTCVDTPFGQLTTYHVMAAVFLGIALVGLVIGVILSINNARRQRGVVAA